jgi:antirestriction protein ArdC
MAEKTHIYEVITDRIISSLESGVIPWRKEWKTTGEGFGAMPVNFATKKPYRGINVLTLLCSGYSSRYWMTYKQAQELGGHVRKGEKASPVVFWKFSKETDKKTGEDKEFAFAKQYSVFNLEQIDGLEQVDGVKPTLPFDAPQFDAIAEAAAIADKYLTSANHPTLGHGGNKAYYSPGADHVQMPIQTAFSTSAAYYSTLFHEFAHSTGNKSRLDRVELVKMAALGDEDYSKEELVAEFTAAFLCAESGCANDAILTNAAAYIQGWMRSLKNDRTLAISAAQKAQHAADYILDRKASAVATETEVTA